MPLNPYDLSDEQSYQRWREAKLACPVPSIESSLVYLEDAYELSHVEKSALIDGCNLNNFVIYQLLDNESSDKTLVHSLGKQLGLQHLDTNLRADEDSVTSLEVRQQDGNQYIPYTNKGLSWHCDGYYNALDHQIRGIIMHCVTPAESGGENKLIDHEMLYIRLRDENPALINALMQSDAMTIPPNIEGGVEIRAKQSGPVFTVDATSGHLHMRYSARKRHIEWKADDATQLAKQRITDLLEDSSLVFQHRLQAGQGIICNNVLHNRTSFEDSEVNKRLMYRARYYDRVDKPGRNRG